MMVDKELTFEEELESYIGECHRKARENGRHLRCTDIDKFEQMEARADLFPELVEALEGTVGHLKLVSPFIKCPDCDGDLIPTEERGLNYCPKCNPAHFTLTKARALQPDKRAQVAEQNRRAAESQETPEGK